MVRLLSLLFVLVAAPLVAEVSAQETGEILKSMGLTVLANRPASNDFEIDNVTTGGRLRLSDFRGRYVLLNFWATWCGPCQEEIPSLDTLSARISEKKLAVLAVSSGEDRAVVAAYAAQNPHRFTVLADPDQVVSGKYGIRALPTTYLIDPQGRVVGGKTGALYWDSPAVLDGLARLTK